MVIACVSQKGGVGKTTLALGAAAYITRQGATAALVDADPQRTAVTWAALREEEAFPISAPPPAPEAVLSEIERWERECRYVVVDGPPRAEALSRAAIIASDLVLLPVEASGASDWAVATTVAQVREAQALRPDLQVAMVLSRYVPRTVIAREIRQHVAEHGVRLLRSGVASRVQLAEALTMGRTIFEWAPRSHAAKEIAALMDEVQELYEERLIEAEAS